MIARRSLVRGISTILLSDGREIHLDDVATSVDCQAVLDDVDAAIDKIESQLVSGITGGEDWRRRAELALKKKRRSRPRILHRISELRRAEREAAPAPGSSLPAGRSVAFIAAAEQLLDHELVTEIWARAQEMRPEAFKSERAPA